MGWMGRRLGACAISLAIPACDPSDGAGSQTANLADAAVPRTEPDAAPPPCEEVIIYPDDDGDGVYANGTQGVPMTLCPGDEVPAGSEIWGYDCDDSDPSVWRTVCADRDGDGAASINDTPCVGADTPPDTQACPIVVEWTPDPGPTDCDDSDPNKIDFFYRDEDRDGYGAGDRVCWPHEPGWSPWGGDCADDDPNRAPYGIEIAGDGLDADCDGTDIGTCTSSFDQFEWPAAAAEPCSGPDLALGVLSCSSCFRASATFAVENRGSTRVGALVFLDGAPETIIPVDLGPGERTLLVSGPFEGPYTLGFSDPVVTDCNPGNNGAYVDEGHCI